MQIAFNNGWSKVKLYFMIGLPTETLDDVAGLRSLAKRLWTNIMQTRISQKAGVSA